VREGVNSEMVTDLGEQPTPEVEPAEPPPGGVDAVEEEEYEPDPVVPDFCSSRMR